MGSVAPGRRAFVETLVGLPFGAGAFSAQTAAAPVGKVDSGSGRANDIIQLPYHEEQDEWFYCIAGEYVVEVGDQRFRLKPGDSVLGPRRVPHAFVYDGAGPGRILIGFTPAARIEQFFRDSHSAVRTSAPAHPRTGNSRTGYTAW